RPHLLRVLRLQGRAQAGQYRLPVARLAPTLRVERDEELGLRFRKRLERGIADAEQRHQRRHGIAEASLVTREEGGHAFRIDETSERAQGCFRHASDSLAPGVGRWCRKTVTSRGLGPTAMLA